MYTEIYYKPSLESIKGSSISFENQQVQQSLVFAAEDEHKENITNQFRDSARYLKFNHKVVQSSGLQRKIIDSAKRRCRHHDKALV